MIMMGFLRMSRHTAHCSSSFSSSISFLRSSSESETFWKDTHTKRGNVHIHHHHPQSLIVFQLFFFKKKKKKKDDDERKERRLTEDIGEEDGQKDKEEEVEWLKGEGKEVLREDLACEDEEEEGQDEK